MLYSKYFFFAILTLFIGATSFAQITGTVIDENGEGLPGATVSIKGTTTGTITDVSGRFSLDADSNTTLVISFVGYISEEIHVNGQTEIKIQLSPDIESLDEVVVVGYGTMKKSDIAGSVVSLNDKDLNPGPITSVSNLLQNTAPGVVMTMNSAQPGGGFNVQVRGQTSLLGSNNPLYVIDGLPLIDGDVRSSSNSNLNNNPSRNPLNSINPEDIASIEVLKDASAAAIYGSRAANGVILITTKKGSGTPTLSYSSSFSVQEIANEYDLLNASQFAEASNSWAKTIGSELPFTAAQVRNLGEGTDWNDLIFRTGFLQKHQLSFSGGNEKTNYYASGNYFIHDGVVEGTSLTRYAARLNMNSNLSEKLQFGMSIGLSQVDDQQVHFGGGGALVSGVLDNTLLWNPTIPVYDDKGNYSLHPQLPVQVPHPLTLLDIDNDIRTKRMIGSAFLKYQIIEGLNAKINLGIDDISTKGKLYIPTTTLAGAIANGEGEITEDKAQNLLSELTLDYSKQLNKNHFINALVGYTYQVNTSEGISILARNFASQNININNLSNASYFQPSSSKSPRNMLISYLGRMNYNLMDKYLITLTMRADGSSKFAEGNKWGFFPSAAIAWKLNNETFFNSEKINELKIRASIGQVGNQELPALLSQSTYQTTRDLILGENPQRLIGLSTARPNNADLTWETSTQLNFGLDISSFKGRVQASLDIYQKTTSNLLVELPLDGSAGFESIYTNAGSIRNKGVEVQIQSINLSGSTLEWRSSVNAAFNENRWLDRGGRVFPGYEDEFGPVGAMYSYEVEGLFQSDAQIVEDGAQPDALPGYFNFIDQNNDGIIDADDRVFIGKTQPDFTWGLSNNLKYKNFDLNFFIQGVQGIQKYNSERARLNDVSDIGTGRNKSVDVLNRWTPDNTKTNVPRGGQGWPEGSFNSVYVENASFIRLRNVTIGYNVPVERLTSIRFYFDVQNLLTFTKWTGLDPEGGGVVADPTNPQSDQAQSFPSYPSARTYTAGLNITF